MKTLKNWTLAGQYADRVELLVDEQHLFCLYVLESNLFRVLIKRHGELALDRTWSIAPQEDVPWEGRDRLSVAGFGLPGYQLGQQADSLTVATPQLRVTIHQPLWLEWEYCNAAGEWLPLAADRPTSAYLLNAHGDGVAHYQRRHQGERYYGLGEKRAIWSVPAAALKCVTWTRWVTTPPAPIRFISISRLPSRAGKRSALACFMTT